MTYVLILLISALLISFTPSVSLGAPAKQTKQIVILSLANEKKSSEQQVVLDSAKLKGEELKIEVFAWTPAKDDIHFTKQINAAAKNKNYIGAIFVGGTTPLSASATTALLKLVSKKPVIVLSAVDTIPNTIIPVYDLEFVGKLFFQEVEALLTKKGQQSAAIALIQGDPADIANRGITDGIKKADLKSKFNFDLKFEAFAKGWDPETIRAEFDSYLTKNNNLDAIIAYNDTIAGVAIEVVKKHIQSEVIVVGQDGTEEARNRLLLGTQHLSVEKGTYLMAARAVEIIEKLSNGSKMTALKTYDYEESKKKKAHVIKVEGGILKKSTLATPETETST